MVRSVGRTAAHGLPEIDKNPHDGSLQFPLYVGKGWRHHYVEAIGNDVAQRSKWVEVAAWEQVTVPAGTFWAFRMEMTNQRLGVPQPAYETHWYAPDVKFYVKGYSREFNWEYELGRYDK
jgi:hypothetical protein